MEANSCAVDSVPILTLSNISSNANLCYMDKILSKLNTDDYKSIFFILMEFVGERDFLNLVKKDEQYMKEKFLNILYTFPRKEAILIEIFGTMKKYDLLKELGICCHIFENEKTMFCRINSFWKLLYGVCEELTDNEVLHLEDKLFPGQNICMNSAEEVLCEASIRGIFQKTDLNYLLEIFRSFKPICYNLITSYKDEPKLNYYLIRKPTRESPCGIALIISHSNFHKENENLPILEGRSGNESDVEALKDLWESFGFKTIIREDLSDNAVLETFKDLAKQDHSSYDAFVACYLSHGDEGVVYASNNQPIRIQDFVDIMANGCKTLMDKPKLFFIQACQGKLLQEGATMDTGSPVTRSAELTTNIPRSCDVLLAVASIPGYVSFRSRKDGSWFISTLVEVLKKYGDTFTIANVMTKVTQLIAEKRVTFSTYKNCKQTSVRVNTLRYELKLKKI